MSAPRPTPDLRGPVSPELLAGLLVVLSTVLLLTGAVRFGNAGSGPSVTPGASAPAPSGTPAPSLSALVPDRASLAAILVVDGNLGQHRDALNAEVAASPVDTGDVATILRQVNIQIGLGSGLAAQLSSRPPTARIGADLEHLYGEIADLTRTALAASLSNEPGYRKAARQIVTRLSNLTAIDARVAAILEGHADPALASPSPSSGSSAAGRPAPSRSPLPASSPSPAASAAPAASVGALNLLGAGGFETGVGPPWELSVIDPATATITADPALPVAGRYAARVDIAAGSDSRSGIALRQGGLRLDAGRRYRCDISARTAEPRELRVRVVSENGDTFGTRLFSLGTDWAVLSFDFTALRSDPAVTFEVDLGRWTSTVWLDEASVVPSGSDPGP